MIKKNTVYIAKSLDGYIADKKGGIDWLETVPNPDGNDMGFGDFISSMDAIVMGRNTFDTVCGFDMDWPYPIPVYVLSNTLNQVDKIYRDKVELVRGKLSEVLEAIHANGHGTLYIDGGKTIQSFLVDDLIDEMIISTIPILIGGGIPLFADLPQRMEFEHVESKVLLNAIVQDTYRRSR